MNTGSDYQGQDGPIAFSWEKDMASHMPILTVTSRGQISKEHDLLTTLEMADTFHVKRLDECRVQVVFGRKSDSDAKIVSSVSSMQKNDLLDEAAKLGIDDVDTNTHISTLRKKVGEARQNDG